jgi:hypothetical protein
MLLAHQQRYEKFVDCAFKDVGKMTQFGINREKATMLRQLLVCLGDKPINDLI